MKNTGAPCWHQMVQVSVTWTIQTLKSFKTPNPAHEFLMFFPYASQRNKQPIKQKRQSPLFTGAKLNSTMVTSTPAQSPGISLYESNV